MDRSPYALEFLLHQFDTILKSIKKPVYKEEVNNLLKKDDWFEVFKVVKDTKSRDYKHGVLERTAAVGSLAICLYDNYPVVDIDLILSGVVVFGFKDAVGRKQVYEVLKNEDLKQIAFKKSRKKTRIEFFLFDQLFKIDNKLKFHLHVDDKSG